MPVKYRIEILPALKGAGYNTTRLRREKLLGESTIQQIRKGELVSWGNISRICEMLNCQPGDILEYKKGDSLGPGINPATEKKLDKEG